MIGKDAGALEDIGKALSLLDPKATTVKARLFVTAAIIHEKSGETCSAIGDYNDILALNSNDLTSAELSGIKGKLADLERKVEDATLGEAQAPEASSTGQGQAELPAGKDNIPPDYEAIKADKTRPIPAVGRYIGSWLVGSTDLATVEMSCRKTTRRPATCVTFLGERDDPEKKIDTSMRMTFFTPNPEAVSFSLSGPAMILYNKLYSNFANQPEQSRDVLVDSRPYVSGAKCHECIAGHPEFLAGERTGNPEQKI